MACTARIRVEREYLGSTLVTNVLARIESISNEAQGSRESGKLSRLHRPQARQSSAKTGKAGFVSCPFRHRCARPHYSCFRNTSLSLTHPIELPGTQNDLPSGIFLPFSDEIVIERYDNSVQCGARSAESVLMFARQTTIHRKASSCRNAYCLARYM